MTQAKQQAQLQFSLTQGKTIHLAACGSVAVYKNLDLIRLWQDHGAEITVSLSLAAKEFITPLSFTALGASKVYSNMFASEAEQVMGHLEPGQNADAFIITPATANIIAKLAHGIADDLISTQSLAFLKPLVIAPAMNPRMWNNPATQDNVKILKQRGHIIVEPGKGLMACREEGQGRLADIKDIHCALLKSLAPQDLKGKNILLTAGPTQEPWDGVRYWTNPSSGLMGACLAMAAYLRGANVHIIAGGQIPWLPSEIKISTVQTAKEMYQASMDNIKSTDIGIFTAAVADFSPEPLGSEKFKKNKIASGEQLSIKFNANPDILATIGKQKQAGQKLVGFAAETENLEKAVLDKLERKNCDLLVGNLINKPGSGFKSVSNTVFIADRFGRTENWPELPKTEVAWRILNWLVNL